VCYKLGADVEPSYGLEGEQERNMLCSNKRWPPPFAFFKSFNKKAVESFTQFMNVAMEL
jgi:hypothetical protein